MVRKAFISKDQRYRYYLSRVWDKGLPKITFIMLNPSTADGTKDDPTIRRLIGFATSWGYGGLYVVNLFAYRSTKPKNLKRVHKQAAIGPENNYYIKKYAARGEKVVLAWGKGGSLYGRDREVMEMIKEPYYIELTNGGDPKHPLYLKKDLVPLLFLNNKN